MSGHTTHTIEAEKNGIQPVDDCLPILRHACARRCFANVEEKRSLLHEADSPLKAGQDGSAGIRACETGR